MTRFVLTALLLFTATSLRAQQVSLSPASTPLWGQTRGMSSISYSQSSLTAIVFYRYKPYHLMHNSYIQEAYIGAFFSPTVYEKNNLRIKTGTGLLNRPFPTNGGIRVNFLISLSYKITDTLELQYRHMSNGFGLLAQKNPGLDNLGLVINLN